MSIYLVITIDITMEYTLVAQWYGAQYAMHEIYCSNLRVMHIRFFVFPCSYQYVPVRTKYIPSTEVVHISTLQVCTYKYVHYKYVQVCTYKHYKYVLTSMYITSMY